MGKKHKNNPSPLKDSAVQAGGFITKKGWKIIGGGISVVLLGFITLFFTDPRGQNFASLLSPFLILGGYGLMGFGILAPTPSDPS